MEIEKLHNTNSTDSDFQGVVDISPFPILIHKMGVVKYANALCLEMFAMKSTDQIIGKNLLEFVHPEDHQIVIEAIKRGNTERVRDTILAARMIDLTGKILKIETKSSSVFFKGEECRVVVAHNYNHIAKVEEDLRNKDLLIEKIAQIIPDSLVVVESKSRRVLFENKPLLDLLGYTKEDLKPYQDQFEFFQYIIHKDDIKKLLESRKFLFNPDNAGKYITTEYRMKDKSGKWRWIQGRSTMMKMDDGQQINFGIAQDITRQKETEEQLKEKNLFIEKITNTIPNNISIFDLEIFKTIYSNFFFGSMLGYTEETIPKNVFELFPEYFREKAAEDFEKVRHLKEGEFYNSVTHYLAADGSIKYFLTRTTPFAFNEKGEVKQMLSSSGDITDLIMAEDQLKKTINELTYKNKQLEKYITSNTELEKFAYIASHDLREPVRSIVGFAQLLQKRETTLDAESKDFLNNIIESAQRMNILIHGLLDYSRVTGAQHQFKQTDLNDLLKKVRNDLKVAIEDSSAEIVSSNLPTVLCDELHIRQLFQNLISNSLKFKKANQPPIIKIDVEATDGKWKFSFTDNGIGLDMKYKEQVFQIFSRLHSADKYYGSGIGLAICKKIVERHGGEIWLDSAPGKGTTFYFTLPA